MKNKKKIGITSAIILIILVIALFFIHSYNNITGTYEDLKHGIAINIEPQGSGYIYQESVDVHLNTAINWKKINNNTYQIQYNYNGQQATFNVEKNGNQIISQKGVNWNGGSFTKTNQKYNNVKQTIYNNENLQASSLYNSNKENVWIELDYDNSNQITPPGNANIYSIVVTKNGKYKLYDIINLNLSDILGKSPQQVIKLAQKNSDKVTKWKKNKGRLFNPLNQPLAFHYKNISYTGTTLDQRTTLADTTKYEYVLIYPNPKDTAVPTIHF